MKKYKITCYPNVESYTTIVEANSVKEALEIANEEADMNNYFYATEEDVKEVNSP